MLLKMLSTICFYVAFVNSNLKFYIIAMMFVNLARCCSEQVKISSTSKCTTVSHDLIFYVFYRNRPFPVIFLNRKLVILKCKLLLHNTPNVLYFLKKKTVAYFFLKHISKRLLFNFFSVLDVTIF